MLRSRARGLLAGIALCIACGGESSVPSADDRSRHDRAVGVIGGNQFQAALEVFREIADRYPSKTEIRVNEAIATLLRQREDDEVLARKIVHEVLAGDPSDLRARYLSGIMYLYAGASREGVAELQIVAERDPSDAYAAYFLAQGFDQLGNDREADTWYQRAIAIDPYLRSAYYGGFQTAARLERQDDARALLQRYKELETNPLARIVELKYTRMGPKGIAVVLEPDHAEPAPQPGQPILLGSRELERGAVRASGPGPNITAVDIDGDERLDLFVANLSLGEGRRNAVLLGGEAGGWRESPESPLARVGEVNAALWGDVDNDGRVDVYLCRRGPNQMWLQRDTGEWSEVATALGVDGGDRNTVDGALFDADHDGSLDVFLVNSDGANALLRNEEEAGFRDVGASLGLAFPDVPSRQVLTTDLDGDRDTDLVVLNATPPHAIYTSEMLETYREAEGFEALRGAPLEALAAADADGDGRQELYGLAKTGELQRWRPDAAGRWTVEHLANLEPGEGRAQLGAFDVSGNGLPELVASSAAGWTALALGPAGATERVAANAETPLLHWAPVQAVPAAGPALLAVDAQGALRVWDPGPGRWPFLSLRLVGVEDPSRSIRSNFSGIGSRVSVRVASQWSRVETFRRHSGPGQSLQPLGIGLLGADVSDFVFIHWSDGIFQSEVDLAVGETRSITETCPVVLAWDGRCR